MSPGSVPPEHGRFADRKPTLPRRVRAGVKLRGKDEPQGRTWIAKKWLALMGVSFSASVLQEGLGYARGGQTVRYEIKPGRIEAQVQGRAAKPYATTVLVPTLSSADWARLIDTMAREAIHAARLLADELAPSIQEAFSSAGQEILPCGPDVLRCRCRCDGEGLCKHAAAVAYLVVEHLDREPMAIFTLRGIPSQQLLDRLRQARTIQTHGVAAAHVDPLIPESRAPVPPLETCMDDFWRPGPGLAELREIRPLPHVHHALLRRLGPSPMNGRFPLVGLLASIYDCVGDSARRLRDRAEQMDNGGD